MVGAAAFGFLAQAVAYLWHDWTTHGDSRGEYRASLGGRVNLPDDFVSCLIFDSPNAYLFEPPLHRLHHVGWGDDVKMTCRSPSRNGDVFARLKREHGSSP